MISQATPRLIAAMQYVDDQIQFTGIVVTYNEERYLYDCLKSLSFCDQLIVVDLGSQDSSIEIATKFGADIRYEERVPIVEQIREKAVGFSRNDWIIFIDPDEIFPSDIENALKSNIAAKSNIALISIPWLFYFKGKPLRSTFWGQNQYKQAILNRNRVKISANVHQGIQPLKGYTHTILLKQSDNTIKHYWAESYSQLIAKHLRYLKLEGQARYQKGYRFSWKTCIRELIASFKYSFIRCKGSRSGSVGFFLSLIYSFYITMGWLSLRKYQMKLKDYP